MPILLKGIVALFGALMLVFSLSALRHGLRLRQAVRSAPVIPDHVEIEVDEGSDSNSYTLIVHLGREIWAVPVYAGKGLGLIEHGLAKDIRAWRDPITGAPIAFRVDGKRIETYPQAILR